MTGAGQGDQVFAGVEADREDEGATLAAMRAPLIVLETPRKHDTIARDYLWKLLAASQA